MLACFLPSYASLVPSHYEKFLGNDSEIIAFGKDEIFQDDEALKNDGRLVEAKNSTNPLQNIFHLLKVSSVAMNG